MGPLDGSVGPFYRIKHIANSDSHTSIVILGIREGKEGREGNGREWKREGKREGKKEGKGRVLLGGILHYPSILVSIVNM